MAAPDVVQNHYTLPTRNPRRRRRNDNEEALSLRSQPQRKRSKVEAELFEHNGNGNANGSLNGHAVHFGRDSNGFASSRVKPVALSRRHLSHDGNLVLTNNDNYAVRQLPDLPEPLRRSTPFAGYIFPSTQLALAFTHHTAYVWNSHTATPGLSTKSFELPTAFHTDAHLPIGALVPSDIPNETGLLAIAPSTGKIAFWENIENADALSLFQQRRNGLEGAIGSMSSGEIVKSVECADNAGFVLLFSSGRAAQLTLRDAQSRPAINVTFLRAVVQNTGFFGGLKTALGFGGYMKSVVAAKSRSAPSRAHTETLIASAEGQFQVWRLGWAGQTSFDFELDARATILAKLQTEMQNVQGSNVKEESVSLLDYAFVSDPGSVALPSSSQKASQEAFQIAALVRTGVEEIPFAVIGLVLEQFNVRVQWTRLLDSWSASMIMNPAWRPRIIIPQLSSTAFVIFDRGVVLLTTAPTPKGLQNGTSFGRSKPFQDSLFLRVEPDYFIVGAGEERSLARSHSFSVSAFLKSHGLISITVFEPSDEAKKYTRAIVSAKSDMEQAIFCGTMPQNPLDLANRSKADFRLEEVGVAATELSFEILSSSSTYLADLTGSMEHQLAVRDTALQNLARHLKHAYPPLPDIEARWHLRWNAEKMAAARAIWREYDTALSANAGGLRLLPLLVRYLNGDRQISAVLQKDEFDVVRDYFMRDLWKIDELIPWTYHIIYELVSSREVTDPREMAALATDAVRIFLGGLEAACDYRVENAWLYNLEGVIDLKKRTLNSAIDVPEFWTSTAVMLDNSIELADRARLTAAACAPQANVRSFDPYADDEPGQLARLLPRMIEMICNIYEERIMWIDSFADDDRKLLAREMQKKYSDTRFELIEGLAEINMIDEGLVLGEKFEDMGVLVRVFSTKTSRVLSHEDRNGRGTSRHGGAGDERASTEQLEAQTKSYFEKFGSNFGTAFFNAQLGHGLLSNLLDMAQQYKAQLTSFLRADPGRRKISWINDVLSEKDYSRASDELLLVASFQESDSWSRKVELSLAKLSLMAAREEGDAIGEDDTRHMSLTQAMTLTEIEEHVQEVLRPIIYRSLDESAVIDNVMADYGSQESSQRETLQGLLREYFAAMIDGETLDAERLIHVLTLMDPRQARDEDSREPQMNFVLALLALQHSGWTSDDANFDFQRRLIWRRLLIRDDWETLNQTAGKADDVVDQALKATALYETLYLAAQQGILGAVPDIGMGDVGELLGTGTTGEDLQGALSLIELREGVLEDMLREDELLRQYMDEYDLARWVKTVKQHVANAQQEEQQSEAERDRRITEAAMEEESRSRRSRSRHK